MHSGQPTLHALVGRLALRVRLGKELKYTMGTQCFVAVH